MKTIKINDITLRDIFQNINPEDLNKKKLLSILEGYEGLKYDSLEIMGGSSFEKILGTGLGMNPFQVCSFIKSIVTSTPLQALIGARNLIGLEIYDKDIIKRFIAESIKNGISVFRVYDSLNDVENFKFTVSEIMANNASCQGTIIYDDQQETPYYVKTAKQLISMGCSSICVKDAESTMIPDRAAALFSLLSREVKVPVFFNASGLRGLQTLNYFEAAKNGCNGFDLSFLPSSYNDFTPTVFSFLLSLKGSDIAYNIDYTKVAEQGELIKKQVYPYIKQDLFSTRFILNQTNKNLLPKWLISDINKQLVEISEVESLDKVLEEVTMIQTEIGNPSLSTPVGQMVGSQAILNSVISDSRWEILSDEIKKLIQGVYGKLPRKVDKDILKKAGPLSKAKKKDKDTSKTLYDNCCTELKKLTSREGDILSYCFFAQETEDYLKSKSKGTSPKKKEPQKAEVTKKTAQGTVEPVSLSSLKNLDLKKLKEITTLVESSNIDEIDFEIDGIKIAINNNAKTAAAPVQAQRPVHAEAGQPKASAPVLGVDEVEVRSPIVGTFYSSPAPEDPPFVRAGDFVKKGATLFIVEAMKHMNRVNSEISGTIKEILVQNEEAVEYDQTLMIIKKDQ